MSLAQSLDVLREELVVQPFVIPEQRGGHVLLVGGDTGVDTRAIQTLDQVLNSGHYQVILFYFRLTLL